MTADIELLPLPNSGSGFYEDNVWHDTFSKRQMEAYARANMEPLIAENERLRAERDSFQRVGIAAQARAERLAEALRELVEMVEMDGFGKGAAMDTARAALEQENDDA